jgi:hypothetical protein
MSEQIHSPFGEAMASVDLWDRRLQRLLEDASMRGLSDMPFNDVENAVLHDIGQERDLYADRHSRVSALNREKAAALADEISRIDTQLQQAAQRVTTRREAENDVAGIADQVGDLDLIIKQKRRKAQSDRLQAKLDEIDRKATAANERLSAEQRRVEEANLKLWQKVADEYRDAAKDAQKRIDEVDAEINLARQRVDPLVRKGVTRTVAGFLLWSGYLSFAAIGSAFAILFHETGEQQSGLNNILGIARGLLSAFPEGWNLGVRLVLGTIVIVAGLAAYCGLIAALDWYLRRFDRRWRADAKRRPKNDNRQQDPHTRFMVRPPGPSTEIRRSSFVQLLASIPYILITAVVAFFAAAATGNKGGSGDAAAGSTINTFIGTVLALLVTASLVMYILKVLDRRERFQDADGAAAKGRWTDGWEFLVVPALLVVTTLCATFRGWTFNIWGPVTLVMLFSCLAVAYGVIYSGVYKDITVLERRKRHFVDELDDLRDWTPPDPDETDEMHNERLLIAELRQRRKELLDAEFDFEPASAPEIVQPSSWTWRKRSAPQTKPRVKYQDIVVPDDEAAPDEWRDRRDLERKLRERQQQLREIDATPPETISAWQERRAEAERQKIALASALESAEFERRRGVAEFERVQELWLVKLRTAYDAALLAQPILMRGLNKS